MIKILIVEDDENIALLESDYLESNGSATKIIGDGNEVIPELKRETYNLILYITLITN